MSLDVFCQDFACSFCGSRKEAITIWQHTGPLSSWTAIAKGEVHAVVSRILYLCFMGCQNFPEPFRNNGCSERDHWTRIDKWQRKSERKMRFGKSREDWRDPANLALQEMGRDHQQVTA